MAGKQRAGKERGLLLITPRGGLFSGMALAGLLAVALAVTADRGNAGGIDGLRAIVAGPGAGRVVIGPPPPVAPTAPAGVAPVGVAAPSPSAASGAAIGPLSGTPAPTVAPAPVPAERLPAATTPPASGPSAFAPNPTAAIPTATPTPTPEIPTATPAPAPASTPTPPPTAAPVSLTTDRGAAALVSLGALVPGDTITRTMAVRNTGTSGFRYTVSATQTAGTALWTDTTFGLQLTLSTPGGVILYSGPLSGLLAAAPSVVAPGGSDDLVYLFSLPVGASNAFQGLAQDLTIVLTATQFP